MFFKLVKLNYLVTNLIGVNQVKKLYVSRRLYIFYKFLNFLYILNILLLLLKFFLFSYSKKTSFLFNLIVKNDLITSKKYFFLLLYFLNISYFTFNMNIKNIHSYLNLFYFNFKKGYNIIFNSYLDYKILLINTIQLPKVLILNKKNNIFLNVLNSEKNLIKSISLGHLKEKNENKSYLRNRFVIMSNMGKLIGEFLLYFFTIKKVKNKRLKQLKYYKYLNRVLYRRVFFFKGMDWLNIIFFNSFYKYIYNFSFNLNISLTYNLLFSFFYNIKSYFNLYKFIIFFNYFFILKKIKFYMLRHFNFVFLLDLFFKHYTIISKACKNWVISYFIRRFDLVLNGFNKNVFAILLGMSIFKLKYRKIINRFVIQHAGCRLQKARRRRFNTAKVKFLNKRIHLFS